MKIFTIKRDRIVETEIEKTTLKNGVEINIVSIGEEGRGRKWTYLPVKKINFKEKTLTNVMLGFTRSGRPKLVEIDKKDDVNFDKCIVILRVEGGYRGGIKFDFDERIEKIAEGEIAQGIAGRMGGNSQFILVMEKGQSIKYEKYGRLYGGESFFEFTFNGQELVPKIEFDDDEIVEFIV